MQHLDEGTIHSWLDGALSADEAAQVDAHVKGCRECAAMVAEARGFIAASSRILTALDNAPRGVIPSSSAPIRRRNWVVWRAAAAVLVVAGGSLMVLRNTGREPQVLNSAYETSASSPGGPAAAVNDENARMVPELASPKGPRSLSGTVAIGSTQPKVGAPKKSTAKTATTDAMTSTLKAAVPTPQVSDGRETRASAYQPNAPVREGAALSAEPGGVAGEVSASAGSAVAVAPQAAVATAQPLAMRLRGAQSLNAVIDSAPLKVVGTPRRIGARVTLYEVAPGDTVTLTEVTTLRLEEVVATGMSTRAEREGATEKTAAVPSQARPDAAQSRPPAAVEGSSDGVTTISWMDATTGNELKLSGRMPVARLQQIKIRIERERAAATAIRKNP